MGIKQKNLLSEAAEYTLAYSGMGGVDLSSSRAYRSRHRFAKLENMYKDYEGGSDGFTESVPGFRRILELGARINGIFSHRGNDGAEHLVIHAGDKLYRIPISEIDNREYAPEPILTVADARTHAYTSGAELYILTGSGIVRIKGNGSAVNISTRYTSTYVPTTYINGVEIEERNMLSGYFIQNYRITSPEDITYGSPGLKYTVISPTERTCAVSGIYLENTESVYIPAYKEISGVRYAVTEISEGAFANDFYITELYLSSKLEKIGRGAFEGCSELLKVVCADQTARIEERAFARCNALHSIHLGAWLTHIGTDAFAGCGALTSVEYSRTEEALQAVEGIGQLSHIIAACERPYTKISVEIPVFGYATRVYHVTLNDNSYPCSTRTDTNGLLHSVILHGDSAEIFSDAEIHMKGEFQQELVAEGALELGFVGIDGERISERDAILGCTLCEAFDGRIFISGNPRLPNTVFYTERDINGRNDPTYFGVMNYFNDGGGSYPVTSLLTAGDTLAVFKAGDDGDGSIFYHTPQETGNDVIPKIYPVSYTHSGISSLGGSVSFYDDPIFLCALGICALEKKSTNLDRSVAVRSHNINADLLTKAPESISMAEWQGYLAVCASDTLYLADPRDTFKHQTGSTEYEWYIIKGLGTYKNDTRVYRYASYAHDNAKVHELVDEPTEKKIYSYRRANGDMLYYTIEGGSMYEVTPTEEMRGGEFSPAVCIHGCGGGKYLFFGTGSGDICVFNNDMRSMPPMYTAEVLDDGERIARYGRGLHPSYYSFAGHTPRYVLSTVRDDCGIPHLTKNTVKHSAVVKMRTLGRGRITCEAGTDRSGYKETASIPNGGLKFDDMDFSCLTFTEGADVTLPISEKEKRWVEKDLNFYSEEFASPFGVSSIAYRFTVKGRIKKQ